MCEDNIGIVDVTPVRKSMKTLGLRRSITKNCLNNTILNSLSALSTPSSLTKNSTGIIVTNSSTPTTTPTTGAKINILGSNSLTPSVTRMSLGTTKPKVKKKKLEFSQTTGSDAINCETVATKSDIFTLGDSTTHITAEELDQEIQAKEKNLVELRLHEERVKELECLINRWKQAFRTALNELTTKIEPPTDQEKILDMLHIPREALNHI